AIASGASTLFTIDGEWEIVSALAADRSFNTIVPTIGAKVETTLPTTYALGQNYPNPFNPTTEIGFSLPQAADVRIEIYNTLGQRVAVLVDEHLGAGHHARVWDASTNASGVYFYRLVTEGYAETRKMMLLK
ncbi:T9SS type A sorting domain-containing protein, partial [Patescibacteria group bacterium]|nr:T9SS type A sorting domain-containing protein [Patescibacteria group bacterium]